MLLFIRLGKAINGDNGIETIGRYIEVIKNKGETWFGTNLISTGFGKKKQEEFRKHLKIGNSIDVLFIVSKSGDGDNTISYKAQMTDFVSNSYETEVPNSDIEPIVYEGVQGKIWIKFNKIQRVHGLNVADYYIESTKKRLDKLLAISRNPFGYIERNTYPHTSHSWTMLSSRTLAKRIDSSCINSNLTNIPVDLIDLFPVDKLSYNNKILHEGSLNEVNYKLTFEVDEDGHARVVWNKQMVDAIKSEFPMLANQIKQKQKELETAYIVFEIVGDNNINMKFQRTLENIEITNDTEDLSDDKDLYEGAKKNVTVNAYERNPKARQECLDIHGYSCTVCNFDFEKIFGDIGKSFIHVHHVNDISLIGKEYIINSKEDLKPVCPNCHAMLHKTKPAMEIDELKLMMKRQISS